MRLEFEGISNARDLGGLTGHGNRTIKMGRIIRSDNLSCATGKDCAKLKDYGLRKIVDFRTDEEINNSPDRKIDGVQWMKNPILKSLTTGITREKETEKPSSLPEILLSFSCELGKAGKEWLASLYIPLVSDEFCLNGYRNFLDVLKNNHDGAVLYHCSAGKDRVGIGTLIFLSILGVDRQDIIKDYLLTNESYASVIKEAQELGRARGVDPAIIDTIEPLSGVDMLYISTALDVIDNTHGGIESFLKNQLGIGQSYIEALRDNYLE